MVEFELRKRHTSLHFEMTDYRNDPRLMSMKGYRTCLFVPRRVSNEKQELLILRGRLGSLHLCLFLEGSMLPIFVVFCTVFSVYCFICLRSVFFCLIFPVSLGCQFLIPPSGFSSVYLHDVTGYRLLLLNN